MSSRLDELFFEVFEPLPRQGPGSHACTARALELCESLPSEPRVLDLGCGAGAQTLDLAGLTRGRVLAVDLHAPLVARLQASIEKNGLGDRVEARVGDMAELGLAPGSFDLVWSEGALYNLGLHKALPLCAELLSPGGYLAFTDAVWLSDERPEELERAFADYPTMGTMDGVRTQLEAAGWRVMGSFVLPDSAWLDDFYVPMEARVEALRGAYASEPDALSALDHIADEPAMRRRCAEHYGYGFFVAQAPAA